MKDTHLVRKGTVSRRNPNDRDVVEAGGVGNTSGGELAVFWLAHYDGVHLLPDQLVAHHDSCLDWVRVHYLGGVIQADILGQVKLLVVDLLSYKIHQNKSKMIIYILHISRSEQFDECVCQNFSCSDE